MLLASDVDLIAAISHARATDRKVDAHHGSCVVSCLNHVCTHPDGLNRFVGAEAPPKRCGFRCPPQ